MVSLSINGNQDRASILAFFNNQPFHTPPLALAMADIAVVRAFTNNNNITITTSNHPLPRTDIEKLFGMKGLSEGEQLGRIFLVMLMYCWASLPLMYLCSFFFSIPSGGFTKMIMVNIITGEWRAFVCFTGLISLGGLIHRTLFTRGQWGCVNGCVCVFTYLCITGCITAKLSVSCLLVHSCHISLSSD
ncbi:ATP-binding cassette sub-family A member 17 [Portunus trituberculatus]|uniref:ATP-binding cassette sub-family A member 17 n=1 Tax=Portunus trituberculatus TaxID=210409 RepID=A0A5B7HYG6_PORTR|nr:ATP-binding cassette sub-family A member 17 [Portunus trituberculatus]